MGIVSPEGDIMHFYNITDNDSVDHLTRITEEEARELGEINFIINYFISKTLNGTSDE